jgi:plasmid stabilization system protein ParE
MKYRVVVSRQALRDVRATFSWIAQQSLPGAQRWRNAFDSAIQRLESNPLGCGRAGEADDFVDRELRQILFKTRRGRTYRAVFVVAGNEVRVLRVRGPGQQDLTDADF